MTLTDETCHSLILPPLNCYLHYSLSFSRPQLHTSPSSSPVLHPLSPCPQPALRQIVCFIITTVLQPIFTSLDPFLSTFHFPVWISYLIGTLVFQYHLPPPWSLITVVRLPYLCVKVIFWTVSIWILHWNPTLICNRYRLYRIHTWKMSNLSHVKNIFNVQLHWFTASIIAPNITIIQTFHTDCKHLHGPLNNQQSVLPLTGEIHYLQAII